jgi:acyl-CoA reductase-like NAD-dependent aldehyde dehydrogenase
MSLMAPEFFKEDVLYNKNGIVKKTIREPLGTVLALLPWESPVLETVFSLVPSILCGNSILLKDSPNTPIFARHFEKALEASAPGLA